MKKAQKPHDKSMAEVSKHYESFVKGKKLHADGADRFTKTVKQAAGKRSAK